MPKAQQLLQPLFGRWSLLATESTMSRMRRFGKSLFTARTRLSADSAVCHQPRFAEARCFCQHTNVECCDDTAWRLETLPAAMQQFFYSYCTGGYRTPSFGKGQRPLNHISKSGVIFEPPFTIHPFTIHHYHHLPSIQNRYHVIINHQSLKVSSNEHYPPALTLPCKWLQSAGSHTWHSRMASWLSFPRLEHRFWIWLSAYCTVLYQHAVLVFDLPRSDGWEPSPLAFIVRQRPSCPTIKAKTNAIQ